MRAFHGKQRYQMCPLAEDQNDSNGLRLAAKEGLPENGPIRTHKEVAAIMTAAGEAMSHRLVARTEKQALEKLRAALADLEET